MQSDKPVEEKIKLLREQIVEHDYKYYVLSEPDVSDYEYDQLLKELEKLEQENPHLVTPDSPTRRVGSDLTKKFNTYEHKTPMLSLSNTYNQGELIDFDRRVHDNLPAGEVVEYVTELKIDGASISLTYKNGYFSIAATRGDGTTGEEITTNVKTIKSVPLKLKHLLSLSNTYNQGELIDFDRRVHDNLPAGEVVEVKIDGASISLTYKNGYFSIATTRGDGTTGEEITTNVKTIKSVLLKLKHLNEIKYNLDELEVRGEIFMDIEGFRKLNAEREANGEKLFANPRNSTAGSLKLQDPKIVASRPLDIFVYYLLSENVEFEKHSENLEILKKLGFKVNPHFKICKDINEVLEYCNYAEELRENLPYEIDGVVIKVNSIKQQKLLGNIAKSPRWATSYKFKAKQAKTVLKQVIWQVGRIGTVTPVADLEPVFLAGSTISRATLHNMDEIERKDIHTGDTVILEKGGDVIPKVVGVDLEKRIEGAEKITMPSNCPVCESELVKPEGEVALYCVNVECLAQVKGAIAHFAHRGAMDIEGLGEQIVNNFVDQGILHNYSDIYTISEHQEELEQLEGFGRKSITNLLNAIEESKKVPFEKVLFALGIRYVGAGAAVKIAKHFGSIQKIMVASAEEIEEIPDIGPSISKSMSEFFANPVNVELVEKLISFGLQFEYCQDEGGGDKLASKKFVLTGTLPNMTRDEAKELIQKNGGQVVSSISAKTDFVLAGEKAGSKYDKALKLGINIISGEEFLEMIGK